MTPRTRRDLLRWLRGLLILGGFIWAWQQPWFGRPFVMALLFVICGATAGELLWRIGLVGREAWLEWCEGNAFMLLISLWGVGVLILMVWLATAHLPWWVGLGASIGYCLVFPAVCMLLLWSNSWIRSFFFSPSQNPTTRGGFIIRNPFPDSYVHAPLPWLIACMFVWSVWSSSGELEKHVSFCRMVHRYVAIEERRLTSSGLDGSFRIPQEDTPEGARYRLLRELGKAAAEVCSPYPVE